MTAPEKKKRIAFLGGGAHTIPTYRALLEKLSTTFNITVYFEFHTRLQKAAPYETRIPGLALRYKTLRELLFAWTIFWDMLFRRYDLIHCHSTFPSGFFGVLAGKLFRIPVLVSLDAAEASGLADIAFGDLLGPRRKKINTWVIRNATAVTALTEFLKREVQQNLHIHRDIHVIPRGVNGAHFQYRERTLSSPVIFLNVAYLHPVKDQETLLKTFALIREKIDCVLMHVGEDYSNGEIQRLATAMNLDSFVTFEGFVPHEKLPDKFRQADMLLHTSRYESQALVVNEAMALGVLVCGTHVGLMADLSSQGCVTVKPRDAESLAAAVLALMADPRRMTTQREQARAWATHHNLEWTAERYRIIYDALMSEKKAEGK
ncbi:glycosyltransferase family 4 protein [Chryseolinea lacunae]|uniref:Glycosyltransferase family 4 protein n=1 Tax=Chryseolinea lacunae TaxID=2801331 RepID=A0ABS1KU76_9BACT|nr:glycosyltransferase family 4 protein [Chryseolinea lacunae]MBL0742267.1 glycosyltransferase family 4 protein [Chryseolinea lacunae]